MVAPAMVRKSEQTHWDRIERLERSMKGGVSGEIRKRLRETGIREDYLTVFVHTYPQMRVLEVTVHPTSDAIQFPGMVALAGDLQRTLALVSEFLPGWVNEQFGLELKGQPEVVHGAGVSFDAIFGMKWSFHGARRGTKGKPG